MKYKTHALDMRTINTDAQVTWIYNQQKQQTLHTLKTSNIIVNNSHNKLFI